METKTQSPSFTVSLRGYAREEVDEYLDSLAEALGQADEAEEQTRRLQAHVARCNARIKELEDRIRADTPRSGIALGERIGVLLHEAEEAASDTVTQADAEAARIVAAAETRANEADELMRTVTARAEEQAHRIETVARGEAADIVAEAEARAAARTRQIEQWAEQVISHTRAEEARLYAEQQAAKEAATGELQALASQRASAACTLIELREAIGRAVGLASDGPEAAPAAPRALPVSTARDDVKPEPLGPAGGTDDLPTGEHPAADMAEGEQFEAKLNAWVTGGGLIEG
jgi:DivIVA domain-containing protein